MVNKMWLFRSWIAVLVYSALCFYSGVRIFALVRYFLPGTKAFVFWPVFILFFYSFILTNLLRLNEIPFLRQFGLYSIAVILYLLLCLALFDAVRLVFWFCKRAVLIPRFSAAGIGAAICLALIITMCGAVHARLIHTKHYSVNIAKNGTDIRIVLLSDLHIGHTIGRAWVAKIVDRINQAGPDMVCFSGDVFDGNLNQIHDMESIIAELRRISAPLGVYACLGNHDVDRIRLFEDSGGTEKIAVFLKEAGIVLLQDELTPVTAGLTVAGRLDARPIGMRQSRKPIAELAASGSREDTLILLDHQPTAFPEAARAGVDLLFCGHTHGGQIFPANFITRSIFRKAGGTHYGYWQDGRGLQAVVTSGAGIWGPPLRVATSSEIAVIDVHFVP